MTSMVRVEERGAAARWSRGAGVHAALTLAALAGGWSLALRFAPVPISDFAAYWAEIGHPELYVKGGLLVWAYLPVKAAGLPPHVAAAVVNSAAWAAFAWALWLPPTLRTGRLQAAATALLVPFALWWVSLFGIVNSDLPHLGLVALGVRALHAAAGSKRRGLAVGGALLLAVGLTFRLQTVVAAAVALPLLVLLARALRAPLPRAPALAVAAALVLAVGAEAALRAGSFARAEIRVHSRVTLYTGLLATHPGPFCGAWTEDSVAAAVADLDEPLARAAWRRLTARPASELAAVLRCKLKALVGYDTVGAYWLSVSLPDGAAPPRAIGRLVRAERQAGRALKLAVLGLAVLALVRAARARAAPALVAAAVPWAVLAGYLVCHAALEIQARYVLEPVAFAVLTALYALGTRPAAARSGVGRELR